MTNSNFGLVFGVSDDAEHNIKPAGVREWSSVVWRSVLAEVISTSLLLLLGCMSAISNDSLPYQSSLYTPLTFGFIVAFNIQSFGHISGAHMNPAVTLAYMLWGRMSIATGLAFIIAQCTGAILGYGLLTYVAPIDLASQGVCVTQPHSGLTVVQAFIIEVALTAALNFINCSVWDDANPTGAGSNSLKFGLTIAGLSFAGGPLTGASMNPARSLGPALWTGEWNAHWVYWAAPLLGGSLSALLYRFTWLKSDTKLM